MSSLIGKAWCLVDSHFMPLDLLSHSYGCLYIKSQFFIIPKCLSSTAFARRKELSPFFSFRNPRERFWLAQFGPDTHPLTNQLWPRGCGQCEMWNFPQNHMERQRCGQSPESEYPAPKRQWCRAGHKQQHSPVPSPVVKASGFMPRSLGLQSLYWFSDTCCLSEALNVYSCVRNAELAGQPLQKAETNVLPRQQYPWILLVSGAS